MSRLWGFLLITLTVCMPISAQEPLATIPYAMENNRIKMTIPYQGIELWLMLDTGASTTVMFQDPMFEDMALSDGPLINFPAFEEQYRTKRIPNITLDMGGLDVTFGNVVMMPYEETISTQMSIGYDGIIGQELFVQFAVLVDPETLTINLYPSGTDFSETFRRRYPLQMVNTRPHVTFTSQLPWEYRSTEKEFLIDTGYPGSLVIWDEEEFKRAVPDFLTRRRMKEENQGVVTYANLLFAKQRFSRIPIFIGANPPKQAKKGVGLLGASLLNHFKYALDFENKSLWAQDRDLKFTISKYITSEIYTPNQEEYIVRKHYFIPGSTAKSVIVLSDK